MGKKDEIIFILDRSGSMNEVRDDAIGGFNTFVENQIENDPETKMTLVQFNHEYQPVFSGKNVKDVDRLDKKSYVPSGMTALLDAVGRTIEDALPRRKSSGGKTVVAILTDGYENSSSDYTRERVAKLIKKYQEKHDWTFFFLGADIDAFDEARALGISPDHTSKTGKSKAGVKAAYMAASRATGMTMSGRKVDSLSDLYAAAEQEVEEEENESEQKSATGK